MVQLYQRLSGSFVLLALDRLECQSDRASLKGHRLALERPQAATGYSRRTSCSSASRAACIVAVIGANAASGC